MRSGLSIRDNRPLLACLETAMDIVAIIAGEAVVTAFNVVRFKIKRAWKTLSSMPTAT